MSLFAPKYELYKSGQREGDMSVNMSRVYFKDACPEITPEFHRVIMHWFFSEYEMSALAAPRGHAKSTMCSQIGILAVIAMRLHHNIMICSSTLQQSVDLLTAIKNELEHNDAFQRDFGVNLDTGREMWNQEMIQIRLADGFPVRITAKSSGSSMRGTKFINWRPSLVLLDDIEDEESVSTPEQRRKLQEWLYSVLIPALDPKNTRIRFVGTILHEDSLLNRCLKSDKWYPTILRAHNKTFSRILWPERFTKDKLMSLREIFAADGKLHSYYREYLNQVIPEDGAFFDVSKIGYVDEAPEGCEYFSAADFAISEREHADFTVITTVGVKDDVMYICDVRRDRWDTFKIVENLIAAQRAFQPTTFTMERGQIERSIGPYLSLEEQKNLIFLNKRYVTPTADKKTRARSLQGLIASGRVRIVRRIDNLARMIYELEKFGSSDHDDCVDSLAYACTDLASKLKSRSEAKVEEVMASPVGVAKDMHDFFVNDSQPWSSNDAWGD